MPRVIMFVFAGRKANMNLQLPYVQRILDEHPNVEYHVWNLCRTSEDAEHVRTISGQRITVREDFYEQKPGWNSVYRHYTELAYRDCLFVKLDDDVVFLETHRFGKFIDAVATSPRVVTSANVVNNGACTALIPGMWDRFARMNIPLLDVHSSNAYSDIAHQHFFSYSELILGQEVEAVGTKDWLSINAIGYDWAMNQRIAGELDKRHPPLIAGRHFDRNRRLGDEGAVNTLPRQVVTGFVAGHLTFGPQNPTVSQLRRWRKNYAALGARYLVSPPPKDEPEPEDEPVVRARWQGNWRERFPSPA